MKKDLFPLLKGVPQYYQLRTDNACGPYAILMVADYLFKKKRGRKLHAEEWSEVLKLTMRNDLVGAWTSKKDLVKALRKISVRVVKIAGRTPKTLRESITRGLVQDHPIIVYCQIPYRGHRYGHYAVIVGMDDYNFYFRDPFRYAGKKEGEIIKIDQKMFFKKRGRYQETVWGLQRWGVELSLQEKRTAER